MVDEKSIGVYFLFVTDCCTALNNISGELPLQYDYQLMSISA